MGCKPVICTGCGGSFPACQIKDGKCASCRAKESPRSIPAPTPSSIHDNKPKESWNAKSKIDKLYRVC